MANGDDLSDERHPSPTTYNVGELCGVIEGRITDAFPDEVWVQGSISSLNRAANGHVYFDLIDDSAQSGASNPAKIPVVLFASRKMLINRILRKAGGMRMHDGIEIRIRGQVTYYAAQGRVQLVMSLIDPQFTLGQMAAARDALLERLSGEGLLERNGELAMPTLPLRVALVTSGGSAAFHDFVEEISASGHAFRLTLLDTRVQGPEAVDSLTEAINTAGSLEVDAVVVVRGGGSRTDLAAFDHERVATAIARCPRPVIVGVGHEIDRSVADEVAHTSAKTPTACAALLVGVVDQALWRLESGSARLSALTELHLSRARDRLMNRAGRLSAAALRATDRGESDIRAAQRRLARSPGLVLERSDARLSMLDARRAALDPAVALQRGWSITRTVEGRLVRSVKDVVPGTELRTTTMDGMIDSRVVE